MLHQYHAIKMPWQGKMSNHNFTQMYSLIRTGFSGERCGSWASCYLIFKKKIIQYLYVSYVHILGNAQWSVFAWPETGISQTWRDICDKSARCREDITRRKSTSSTKRKWRSSIAKAKGMFWMFWSISDRISVKSQWFLHIKFWRSSLISRETKTLFFLTKIGGAVG